MKELFLKFIQSVLRSSARRVIEKFNPTVIAITGSVGKTSTREAIYAVLHDHFGDDVRRANGNLNTEIGLPLAILGFNRLPEGIEWVFFLGRVVYRSRTIKKFPKYLVLEMGVDKPGDIAYLASIAQPHYIVLTSLQPAHIAGFSDVREYQLEKLSLLPFLQPNGKIFVNADDPELSRLNGSLIERIGIDNTNVDYRGEILTISLKGMEYRISCAGYNISVHSQVLGNQLVYPSLFASAIARVLGISLLQVGKSLEKIKPLPSRMRLIDGKHDSIIIDDSYNANPTSVRAALDFLSRIDYAGRKVAILGNMNELGVIERDAHQEIGAYARERCDLAIFAGKNAENMAAGFGSKENVIVFNDRSELLKNISHIVKDRDLILVKASQNGNYFEEVVKKLMKNPKEASSLLVRQSRSWLKKKK